MSDGEFYITRLSAWVPGINGSSEWHEWAQGSRQISSDSKGPEISFTDSLFRRRLSQVSRMTIQVIHDLLPLGEDTKIFFLSLRGELSRQYQINKMLIEEKALMPAAFSLSVFNAPVALAAIALGLKGGYSTIFPPETGAFATGLAAAKAALFCGTAEEIAFVYADEQAPPEYGCFFREDPPPAAFGLLLSREPRPSSVPMPVIDGETDNPLVFLKKIILNGKMHVSP